MVEEIFDNIAYEKGASIIRMLNSHLGADVRTCIEFSILNANRSAKGKNRFTLKLNSKQAQYKIGFSNSILLPWLNNSHRMYMFI